MIVLESCFVLVGELRGVMAAVSRRDRSLGDQMRRAGEASELKAALRLVRLFGYADVSEEVFGRCDEVCAMLYRLSR